MAPPSFSFTSLFQSACRCQSSVNSVYGEHTGSSGSCECRICVECLYPMSIRSQLVQTLVVLAATLIIPKNVLAPSPIKIVNFSGVITKVSGDTFEVFTNPNADPQSAYKMEKKSVRFNADTIFLSSEKSDLKVGREVQ